MEPLQEGPAAALDELLAWDFADRIRKVRKRIAQLGQREFAAALGVGWQAYAQWEAGNNQPKNIVATARRVEMLTNVPAAWLLGLDEPITQSSDTPIGPVVKETIKGLYSALYLQSPTPDQGVSVDGGGARRIANERWFNRGNGARAIGLNAAS